MTGKLPEACLDQLFVAARTHNAWRDQDVPDLAGPHCSCSRFDFDEMARIL